ncbi:MAG: tRNA adenosine(34) deaminase TadA [Chloroflexota bacterium]|nr:tRNA adenosine(34) deaminase TadA [Chloroflexota bacterium]
MNDFDAMRLALDEARAALLTGDVPIGAIAVLDGRIVGSGRNRREADHDATAHAELLALQTASRALGRWRLDDVTLYCTLEPCAMCAGAMVLARLGRLVYGAVDLKAGMAGSIEDLLRHPRLNHRVDVSGGLLAHECGTLLRDFFGGMR